MTIAKKTSDTPATAVVFDVEFTAWEGAMETRWLRPGEFKEIIQIGAVRVDETFAPTDSFGIFVRPRINPVLSPYLEGITGITNATIAAEGVSFSEAFRRFMTFAAGLPLVAYGRDDLVLKQNLRLNGMKEQIPPYTNIIGWMGKLGVDVRKGHGCDVGPKVGVPFSGRMHDARDDAASLASGIAAMIARGAAPPTPAAPPDGGEADNVIRILNLTPHPEGGAFREIFRDEKGADGRSRSTGIYFLLQAGEISRKHRIDAAEVWHYYRGAPIALTVEAPGEAPRRHVLGPRIEAGEEPQIVVPPHAWQSAVSLGAYTLVGCTVAPGFEFSQFELAET